MIFGIGNDIVEISRIANVYAKYKDRFARKILTPQELLIFKDKLNAPNFLAKRFAAKEALAKALGIGIRKPFGFQSISIINNSLGKPIFNFNNEIQEFLNQKKIQNCHLSISDEKTLASAVVILEQ